MAENTILKTVDLSIGYANHLLFENLHLSLCNGELICFMGPNGVGKSTLIRTLCGLQKPMAGTVELPLSESSKPFNANQLVAVVLTDKISAQNMTVYELVTYGRYPYLGWDVRLSHTDKKIIDQSITQLNIAHLIDKKLYQLSDGQLQMSMIARALAQDTPLIILDEPTAHLDLNNRVEIMKLLKQLTRSLNKSILIATHDLDLALQTADTIWLTGKEKNIIVGLPEDLVLNGSFDTIFQFKGFDLKTGKVQHEPFRNVSIQLAGEGYAYLWTKNALERNGYAVNQHSAKHTLAVFFVNQHLEWTLDKSCRFTSLVAVLAALQK